MKNDLNEELIKIEKQLEDLANERAIIIDKMEKLKKYKCVQQYIILSSQNSVLYGKLTNLKESYINLKQRLCTHPIWFFVSETTDDYEGRTYYTCRCLECGKVEERRNRDFENIIRGDFSRVKEEYDKRKSNPQTKAKQMIKKYQGGKR